jgi:hypothetical protein
VSCQGTGRRRRSRAGSTSYRMEQGDLVVVDHQTHAVEPAFEVTVDGDSMTGSSKAERLPTPRSPATASYRRSAMKASQSRLGLSTTRKM